MITLFVFALAAGLGGADAPAEEPPTILDLFAAGAADGLESERSERCRVYNCGIPMLSDIERLNESDPAEDRR